MEYIDNSQDQDNVLSFTAEELWNDTKFLSWKMSSTKNLSEECMSTAPFPNNDIKNISKKDVEVFMNSFFLSKENEDHPRYLGPQGLIEWIYDEKAVSTIPSRTLCSFLFQNKHLSSYEFLLLYKCVHDFFNFSIKKLNVTSSEFHDDKLIDLSLFMSYVEETNLTNLQLNNIRLLITYFFPQCDTTKFYKNKKLIYPLNHPFLNKFFSYLKDKGVMESTIVNEKCNYLLFLSWLKKTYAMFHRYEENNLPLFLVTREHLLAFRHYLLTESKNGRYSEHTISNRFYDIRALFNYLYQEKLIPKDISSDLSPISFERYKYREIPDDQEINRFFEVISIYSEYPSRDIAAFGSMLFLGLRVSEVVNLRWEHINFSNRTVSIRGKKGKYDILPLPNSLNKMLEDYQSSMLEKTGFVFSNSPNRMKKTLYEQYKLFSLVSGWHFPGGLHLFRHTFITRLSERKDCPLQVLMKLARHVNPLNTSLYIHRNDKKLTSAINNINYFEE